LISNADERDWAAMAKELLKLRMKHGLSLNDVADICGFDVVYVARMELGVPVTLYYARRLRRRLAAHLDMPLAEAILPVVLIGDEGGSNIQIGMRK
jgi:transcriptional regulator with XRE-family HTH domain